MANRADREKVIAAYDCYMTNLSDSKCENCPYGYGYTDLIHGEYFVGCNTVMMFDDAISLLHELEPKEG